MSEVKEKSKREKKADDVFMVWWKKYKTVMGVISAIVSATVAFNIFLYERVLKPNAEVSALKAQKEYIMDTISLDGCYKELVESLSKQLLEKEAELKKLKYRLAELLNQSYHDKEKIASLEQQIAIKEEQINFYKIQIFVLEDHLKKSKKLIERLKSFKIISDTLKVSLDQKELNTIYDKQKDNNAKILANTSKNVTLDNNKNVKRPYFRSKSKKLSVADVKKMILKFNFHCSENAITGEYCNPNGLGFDNNFEIKIIKDDTIVVDKASGLMWLQRGSVIDKTYKEAKIYIDDLNSQAFAGFNDWRMPTLEEAMSLLESKLSNRGLYIDPVFNLKKFKIWTVDLPPDGLEEDEERWVVDHEICLVNFFMLLASQTYYVLAVRSEQLFP